MTIPLQPPQPAQVAGRDPARAFLVALLGIVIFVWAWLEYNLLYLDPGACVGVDSRIPGWKFVGVAAVGLLAGRYAGALRFLRAWDVEDRQDPIGNSATAGRQALAVVFAALVVIFIYEAIGTYQPSNGLEPITYYVRCSIWLDDNFGYGIKAMLVVLLISFLFGHWLWAWHANTRQYRGRMGQATRELFDELARTELSRLPGSVQRTPRHRHKEGAPDANRPGT